MYVYYYVFLKFEDFKNINELNNLFFEKFYSNKMKNVNVSANILHKFIYNTLAKKLVNKIHCIKNVKQFSMSLIETCWLKTTTTYFLI